MSFRKLKEFFCPGPSPYDVYRHTYYRPGEEAVNMIAAAQARPGTSDDISAFIDGLPKDKPRRHHEKILGYLNKSPVYVVQRDCDLQRLCGASALTLIVPKGITMTVQPDNLGHANVYDMNDFTIKSVMLVTGADEGRSAARQMHEGIDKKLTVRRISLKQKAS
jgi:hypothetical protein